ncbi:MAG: VOC family protein [Gammaproteobacteria bacterium]|nr:VOC family protein [Gammaproteobacteria bacterium]
MEAKVSVLSVHHVSLLVKNTAKALEFYSGILGLALDPARPDMKFSGAWLNIGEQQIHLLELPNPDPVDGRPEHGGRDRHLALLVDALSPIEQALDAHNISYTRSKSGRKAIFCRDFDGNGIELIEAAS